MDFYLGQIAVFPYNFVPEDWAECHGQFMSIRQNQELFTLLGHRFGGDGRETFALPDYSGKAPSGSRYFICIKGRYPFMQY